VTVAHPVIISIMMRVYTTAKTFISEKITVGNGIAQKNGERLIVTLKNVKFVPELWINLFRIGKALKKVCDIGNDSETMKSTNGNVTFTFDTVVKTKNWFVPGIRLMPVLSDIWTTVVESGKREYIDVNNLHKIIEHYGKDCEYKIKRKSLQMWRYRKVWDMWSMFSGEGQTEIREQRVKRRKHHFRRIIIRWYQLNQRK
jgi:hypothetical protein